MESEAGSEEGRAIQASWNALDLGGGLQEAGTRGPPGTAGPLGPRQAAACGRASEASVFRVEAMQEGESLEAEQEEVRLGEGIVETVQVLTGAVVEEDVELQEKKAVSDMDRGEEPVQPAVWEEQGQASAKEEKPAEPEQALAGRNRSCGRSPLEALEALQLEMEPMNKQARQAQGRLQLRISKRWKAYLELRGSIIQDIHGFWATVFVNHPGMSAMIGDQDENMLSYLMDLQVEEFRHRRDFCKIRLFFRSNPYFHNQVIVKEYVIHITGYKASHATPIRWYPHYACEAYGLRHQRHSPNFFNWVSDHHCSGSGKIAEIISKDLWPDALKYYVKSKAPQEESRRRTGNE
ncbi:testis-specific Y-encoded protein 2-like [Rhinolophus sinicus]|uniref:testis-specific Y-encoded protein 2-like n=1 Tax=Rhinolophus sinicus TaxID=89399 RepID=UPI003D79FD03